MARRLLWLPAMLVLLACADPSQPELGAPMDRMPDRTVDAGGWRAEVVAGRLTLSGGGGEWALGEDVLPEMAVAPDQRSLVFARHTDGPLSDLYLVSLPPGEETRLTDWATYEDRPVFSPDGKRLAFFSGRTGYASLFVMDVAAGGKSAVQLTNVGLETRKKRPGHAPEGFVAPPDTPDVRWEGDVISWTAQGAPVSVEVPR